MDAINHPQTWHVELMRNAKRGARYIPGEDFSEWRARARAILKKRLGLPFGPCDERFEIESVTEHEAYTAHRLRFFTEARFQAIAELLIPKRAKAKPPVMICLQGHSKGMHISLGRPIYPGDAESIAGDRDFAVQAVERGYAALALEQRGFGELGGTEAGPACHVPAMAALLLGRTLIGERVWDISRAIDMLESHFPQVDAGRVGIMGNSGGGTAIIYAMALEERIRAAMPSCALCGFLESIGAQKHCVCNFVPGIMEDFDMGDIASLFAPKPLVVVNGAQDEIFPIDSAKRQFAVIQANYSRLGAPDACRHVIGALGHRFYADAAWQAFMEATQWRV